MEQPLFSCTLCLKSFTQPQMSKSGTTCKVAQIFCKYFLDIDRPGTICPRCQSSKSKYGEPKPCTICLLPMAYGSALVCQRCLHYRNKFGDPRQCQKCLQVSAFYKDEISRGKVDGQVLCWVCTYNFKMAKSRESKADRSLSMAPRDLAGLDAVKRQRTEDYTIKHSATRNPSTNYSMGSAYNEHLLTIGQLQDDISALKRQLAQKDAELLAKDRVIGGLKADLDDYETQQRERAHKSHHMVNEEINKLKETIRTLQREKNELVISAVSSKKRKFHTAAASSSVSHAPPVNSASPLTLSPLRIPPRPPTKPPTTSSSSFPKRSSSTISKADLEEKQEDKMIPMESHTLPLSQHPFANGSNDSRNGGEEEEEEKEAPPVKRPSHPREEEIGSVEADTINNHEEKEESKFND